MTVDKHPKLVEVEELKEKIMELEREVLKEQHEHRKLLIPEWEYTVQVGIAGLEEGDEYITILSTLTNPEEFDRHMRRYGSIMNRPDSTTRSVKYYRKHGLLLHEGGGHLILKDEQLCSDEEWEAMKQGDIPEKFLRR